MTKERDLFRAIVVSGLALSAGGTVAGCNSETVSDAAVAADARSLDAGSADSAMLVADATSDVTQDAPLDPDANVDAAMVLII